jgi:hypothetical protein
MGMITLGGPRKAREVAHLAETKEGKQNFGGKPYGKDHVRGVGKGQQMLT